MQINESEFVLFVHIIRRTWTNILVIRVHTPVFVSLPFRLINSAHPTVKLVKCQVFISFDVIVIILFLCGLSGMTVPSLFLFIVVRVKIDASHSQYFSLLLLSLRNLNHAEASEPALGRAL